jgi:CRISPR-associated protein Cas2
LTVIVAERVPASLRGYLTRWMLEVHPGVFVGTVSARVRDALWERLVIKRRKLTSSVLLLHNTAGEQGFTMLSAGTGSRQIADFDGLLLLRRADKGAPARAPAARAGTWELPAGSTAVK